MLAFAELDSNKKSDSLEMQQALQRMKDHAPKARANFIRALAVKAPDVRGRLAGPASK